MRRVQVIPSVDEAAIDPAVPAVFILFPAIATNVFCPYANLLQGAATGIVLNVQVIPSEEEDATLVPLAIATKDPLP